MPPEPAVKGLRYRWRSLQAAGSRGFPAPRFVCPTPRFGGRVKLRRNVYAGNARLTFAVVTAINEPLNLRQDCFGGRSCCLRRWQRYNLDVHGAQVSTTTGFAANIPPGMRIVSFLCPTFASSIARMDGSKFGESHCFGRTDAALVRPGSDGAASGVA